MSLREPSPPLQPQKRPAEDGGPLQLLEKRRRTYTSKRAALSNDDDEDDSRPGPSKLSGREGEAAEDAPDAEFTSEAPESSQVSKSKYTDATTSTQGLPEEKSAREHFLEKKVEYRLLEVSLWRNHAHNLDERVHQIEVTRDEALLREERAQWMRMGAEKRLKDLQAEYNALMESVKQKNKQEELPKRFRLMGKIEEMVRMVKEVYCCCM